MGSMVTLAREKDGHCAHPNFNLVGVRNARAYETQLGSVHLPRDARRTHVRRSRHLSFYDPKVESHSSNRSDRFPTRTETASVRAYSSLSSDRST
ncbi:hypothetical protein CRG98_026222 [Punica granatum]|uniref:Uncharacterized protein n=1 Tax=Punica granatum TaxID=22663 RepID=A0A2I0JAV9_PUNGR|nr:hypothetical protein CRG98_026222 [Punica granatum]